MREDSGLHSCLGMGEKRGLVRDERLARHELPRRERSLRGVEMALWKRTIQSLLTEHEDFRLEDMRSYP